MLFGRLVYVGKTLTDLQILGCEFYKKTFGGRGLLRPEPLGAIALPQIPCRYKGRGGREGERKGWE